METTKMNQETNAIFQDMREKKFETLCRKSCMSKYYKNQMLEYCIRHNSSIPCITGMYAEMLQTYSKYFSQNHYDIYHANEYIPYLNIYCDEKMLKYIADLFYELRFDIQNSFPDKLLLLSFQGRLKSARSFEAKRRSGILNEYVLDLFEKDFKSQLEMYQRQIKKINPQDEKGSYVFSDEDFAAVNAYFSERQNQEPIVNNDSIGYRIIVENYNHSTEEEVLTGIVHCIHDICYDFFVSRGYKVFRKKDYIAKPKPNGYQSLHFTVLINNIPVEVQLRTKGMHKVAELGTASYHQIYKNTALQKYVKNFLYRISKQMDNLFTHEDIGLLECIPLPKQSIHQTPLAKIPKIPADFRDFPDLDLLQKIYEESPKIC